MLPSLLSELHFPDGLVGLPSARNFTVEPWGGDTSPYLLLHNLDDPGFDFLVVAPEVFFPDYEPEIDAQAADGIEVRAPEDAVVLVVVTVREPVERSTANLLGPLVVNRTTGAGVQSTQSPDRYQVDVPLFPPAVASLAG